MKQISTELLDETMNLIAGGVYQIPWANVNNLLTKLMKIKQSTETVVNSKNDEAV